MKRVMSLAAVAALVVLAGCAGPQAREKSAARAQQQNQQIAKAGAAEGGITCTTEYKTGSHVPHRVCLTEAARKAREQAAQDSVDRMNRRSGSKHGLEK